jgi:hypothetical protein
MRRPLILWALRVNKPIVSSPLAVGLQDEFWALSVGAGRILPPETLLS